MGESEVAASQHDPHLFRDVFNASPVGIAVENLDGQPIFVNPAFCSFLGFSEEELRTKHCVDFSPPEDAEKDWALFRQLKAGSIDHYQLEKRYYRKDGSLVWGSLSISLLNGRPSPLVIAIVEDITDKKRAEEEFANADERLQLAIESASVGGWDYDLKTGQNLWFGKAHGQLGMAPDETSGSLNDFWDHVHQDDRERLRRAFQLAKDRHERFTEDFRVVWRDGTTHWLHSQGRYHYGANGQPERMLGISLDITKQKLAEEELFRYAAIVESSDDAISSVTLDGVIVTWNQGAQRMFGYTENEAVGKPARIIVPPELRDQQKEILERLWAGGRVEQFETVRVSKTGKRIDVSLSISPVKDSTGKIVGCAGISRDITKRKRAEEALCESEERLRLAVKAGKMFAYSWDAATDVIERSGESAEILGVKNDQAATGAAISAMVHPDDKQRLEAALAHLTVEAPTLQITYRIIRPDGTMKWLERNSRAYFDSQRKLERVIGMVVDVTEHKQMEEALSDLSRKLIESQEQERARIGRELHDDINQKLAMLGVELEQLLENPSEVQNRAQELRKQTTELSNDVQALSHDLHSSKLEYLGIVAGIKSWCKEFAERQRAEIDFNSDVRSALPFEIGLSLFRVLQEALHNAMKHSGVKRIEVQLREDSCEVHLIVRDSGKGFDVQAALQDKGLGLTSMRERVRLVNGTISIDSKPMGGTTIHVRVPFGLAQKRERAAG